MSCCGKKAAEKRGALRDLAAQLVRYKRGEPVLRDSCKQCACKHIAQARALLLEMSKGYEYHYWFAMGHLAEAEDELLRDFPVMARRIRDERLKLQSDRGYLINFADLVTAVDSLEEPKGVS